MNGTRSSLNVTLSSIYGTMYIVHRVIIISILVVLSVLMFRVYGAKLETEIHERRTTFKYSHMWYPVESHYTYSHLYNKSRINWKCMHPTTTSIICVFVDAILSPTQQNPELTTICHIPHKLAKHAHLSTIQRTTALTLYTLISHTHLEITPH